MLGTILCLFLLDTSMQSKDSETSLRDPPPCIPVDMHVGMYFKLSIHTYERMPTFTCVG